MKWRLRASAIKVGDRVAVAARFLRSTGQHVGDICFCRGNVTALRQIGEVTLAEVAWEPLNGSSPDVPGRMLVSNLSKVTERGIMDLD